VHSETFRLHPHFHMNLGWNSCALRCPWTSARRVHYFFLVPTRCRSCIHPSPSSTGKRKTPNKISLRVCSRFVTRVDPELTQLALRLREYRMAPTGVRTVGHIRRLVEAVAAVRSSRCPGKRNIGDSFNFLGPGISNPSVNR